MLLADVAQARDAHERPGDLRSTGREFIFPPLLRWAVLVYVPLVVVATVFFADGAHTESAYAAQLARWVGPLWAPALIVAVAATARVRRDERKVWVLWSVGVATGFLSALGWFVLPADTMIQLHRSGQVPLSIAVIVALGVANVRLLKSMSGARAAIVDVVELFMITVSITGVLAVAGLADLVVEHGGWLTTSAVLWGVASVHGIVVASAVSGRIDARDRAFTWRAAAVCVAALVAAAVQLFQASHNFGLATGPAAASFVFAVGMVTAFLVWAQRGRPPGLERMRLVSQVRRRSAASVVAALSAPVLGVLTWLRWDAPVAAAAALVALVALATLSAVRALVVIRENASLHRAIEAAADERLALLSELLDHGQAERLGVAALLHRQTTSIYAALGAFDARLRDPGTSADAAALAAERLRADLERQSAAISELAAVMGSRSGVVEHGAQSATSLDAPLRSYLESACDEDSRPRCEVEIAEGLVLPWSVQVALLRIAEEALHNVGRHARATIVSVSLDAGPDDITLTIADNGVGLGTGDAGAGIRAMEAYARVLGGHLWFQDANPGTRLTVSVPHGVDLVGPKPLLKLV